MSAPQHYLVVDLEATCSEDGSVPRHQMETIEIGAVMVAARDLQPVAEFQRFIQPVRRPHLTEFCTRLTSIRQSDVDGAQTFPQVLDEFVSWTGGFPGFVFCSWGNYDRNQLRQDCAHHGRPYPFEVEHLNLKSEFARRLGLSRKVGTSAALRVAEVERQGTHHRGIDDARSIALLLPRIFGRDEGAG